MKEEPLPKAKNQFQLELEAKMKDRRNRGLTTALSPSPTDLNQDSLIISDDEDDILTSLHRKSVANNKSKWNPPHLNETMQWGDSQYWNHSLLQKDDKISDPLDFRNKKSPPWKESPRSGDGSKGYLKSKLSPRNNTEIDSLQIQNSPRSFKEAQNSPRSLKEAPSKLDIRNSPRGEYKPERKKLSYSDHVDESPRSTGSAIDQSLSSVSEAHNTTNASSGQRFLKSSKKVKSISIEKDEEKSIQDEIDSPRPVPRVRKKSLTPTQYAQPQDLQMEENILDNDSDRVYGVRSSARMRRQASKASIPSSASQDNLNLSSGKNSPSTVDMKIKESPRSPKEKDIFVKETEKMKPMQSVRNKNSLHVTDSNPKKNDPELEEKKTKRERQEKSNSLDKQSSRKVVSTNDDYKTSVENKSTEDKSPDRKTSFSRRGSLQTPNKSNENRLNSANRIVSPPQNRSSVFDFLTEDIVEPKPTIEKQKSLENKNQSPLFITDSNNLGTDTSSLCEESTTDLHPTPIPRSYKNQRTPEDGKVKTEREIYEEAIQQVEDCQNSETVTLSKETDKNSDSSNKTVAKPKPTARKPFKKLEDNSAAMLDTKRLREEIFQEWKIQKNRIIKEQKKKKIEEEEKKKKELEEKRTVAVLSFESWKKQKEPMLKQKFKIQKTKQEEEFEKKQKLLEKKQESANLYELWKEKKDAKLKIEYSKKKEEEQKKKKLLSSTKQEKQKSNISSFNTWKEAKDKVLQQKKKEELETTKLMQRQLSYDKMQKETMSDESYQQWLLRKEEQEKQGSKKRRGSLQLANSPLQAWRPPSRTIPC